MSGIAIIIRGADFSDNNVGQVTFLEDVDVTGIVIENLSSYTGKKFTLTVSYLPINTNQRGCTWAITNGNQYASINASTGELTISNGANSSLITVEATSVYDSSVTATASFRVTYSDEVPITALEIQGDSVVEGTTKQYTVAYTPSDTTQRNVNWSVSNSSVCSIDNTGLLTINSNADNSQVVISAVSAENSSVVATKTVTLTYKEPIDYWNLKNNVGKIPLASSAITRNRYVLIEFKEPVLCKQQEAAILYSNQGTAESGLYMYGESSSQYYKCWSIFVPNGQIIRVDKTHDTFTKCEIVATWNKGGNVYFDGVQVVSGAVLGSKSISGMLEYVTLGYNSTIDYTTNEELETAVSQGVISPSNTRQDLKLKRLAILYATQEYSSVEEAFAAETPQIDIKVNNGVPYNDGTNGETLIYTNFE